MTPQVVTETLFALLIQKSEKVDEIIIITTAEGKKKIIEVDLTGKIKYLCKQYCLNEPNFSIKDNIIVAKEESIELSDVRTNHDNQLFPNLIVDVIRNYTNDQSVKLHCSIAGGRKTMSVAMAYALSLFGRKQDVLSHVLVSNDFEKSGKFFPENNSEGNHIVLAEIPYIRLREKLPLLKEHPYSSYDELVRYAQQNVDEIIVQYPLIFDTKLRSIKIGDKCVKLQPIEFAIYLLIATQNAPVPAGKRFPEKLRKKFLSIYNKVRITTREKELNLEQELSKNRSTINRRIEKVTGKEIAQYYYIQSEGVYGNKFYRVILSNKKIKVIK